MEDEKKVALKKIEPYFKAFEARHRRDGLTQKSVADHCGIRPSSLSTVFKYFKNSNTDKQPLKITLGELNMVLTRLKSGTKVSTKGPKTSLLDLVGEGAVKKEDKNIVTPYPNYDSAEIAKAVAESGEDICILNTYLGSKLFDGEASDDDPNRLKNWIVSQKKKVRLLLLRPDGKAMRLRTKTNLGESIADLTRRIISGLEAVLKLKEQYPEQIEIRLMDELPGVSCVILTNKLFYGLHYSFGHAEVGPVFAVTNATHFTYIKIKEHFDTLWSEERSQSLDKWLLAQVKNAVQVVYNRLDYLIGEWEVFIHKIEEVYKGEGPAPDKVLGAGIEKFILDIQKNDRDIYPKAMIILPNLERLTGSLVTEYLQDRDYAHIRFTDHTRISIHLTIHCRYEGKVPLLGFYTMSSSTDSCTGTALLYKKEQGALRSPSTLPESWKRQLAFCDGAFMSLKKVSSTVSTYEKFPYAGVYKVYSYGGKPNGAKSIKINWLKINEWGEATYKNQHYGPKEPSGILAGRATEIDKNTHIVFTGFKPQKRRSYLIIYTDNTYPEEGRYYSAVHLGVSWDRQMPTGKRFILELVKEDFDIVEPKLVLLHSPEYYQIQAPLRKLLSGRVKNLLGFLRQGGAIFDIRDVGKELEHSVQMSNVFFHSACMLAKESAKEAASMLFRAVNHGFDDLDKFEQTIISMVESDILKEIQATEDYKNIQKLLKPPMQ